VRVEGDRRRFLRVELVEKQKVHFFPSKNLKQNIYER